MATTRIWAVKRRADHVLDYAMNPEKTGNPAWGQNEYQTMRDVMDYAMNDAKTEQQYYVTALNCDATHARDQMQMVKRQFGKTDGILAYHGYQSFLDGEVDADTAHVIGVKLAQALWPEHQVIVATHLNTHCYHNHFVVNSVSHLHGGKFNACKESYRKMRIESDRLCKAYGLSVVTEHKAYYPKHYAEWDAQQRGLPTWRSVIRVDVDAAIKASMTWSAFLRCLHELGYEIKTGVKHVAIRPQGKERFVRLRSLGEDYTEDAIRQRILRQHAPERPLRAEPQQATQMRVYGDFRLSKVTWKGLRALYFFYLRRLRAAQTQPQESIPYLLRDDLRQLDKISAQAKFLFAFRIDTAEQLVAVEDSISDQIARFSRERSSLTTKKRHADTEEEHYSNISKQAQEINAQLSILRHERHLCCQIIARFEKMHAHAEDLQPPYRAPSFKKGMQLAR